MTYLQLEKEEIRSHIYSLHKIGDWKSILRYQFLSESQLMWIEPQIDDLQFFQSAIKSTESSRIVSVGAGCGLLEWLIQTAVGVNVIGLEIDPNWWQSRYSPPVFIPLLFPDDPQFFNLAQDENSALMFCYFNNGPAFCEYLNNFRGSCVIIIGSERRGVHTDPKPFDLQNKESGWSLHSYKKVHASQDVIVLYTRHIINKHS